MRNRTNISTHQLTIIMATNAQQPTGGNQCIARGGYWSAWAQPSPGWFCTLQWLLKPRERARESACECVREREGRRRRRRMRGGRKEGSGVDVTPVTHLCNSTTFIHPSLSLILSFCFSLFCSLFLCRLQFFYTLPSLLLTVSLAPLLSLIHTHQVQLWW